MNKHTIMLVLAGVAAGYLLSDTLTSLNGGSNPFAGIYLKGTTLKTS